MHMTSVKAMAYRIVLSVRIRGDAVYAGTYLVRPGMLTSVSTGARNANDITLCALDNVAPCSQELQILPSRFARSQLGWTFR